MDDDKVILLLKKTFKHSAPNRPSKPFVYHSYKGNEKPYIVNCMQFYFGLRDCKVDNKNKNLETTYGKHIRTSQQTTILEWLKCRNGLMPE